ncbi:glutamine-hydrolyzing carbamoyl-phosphate synthase small subunit [Buchnera aphidicola]|uniref:Carbamoyl phosphate synthase small chain n=1 Tax=Buchnera aphidicola (Cinara cf. splendens/pseudotsugae 3390) TaxID=2518980 RepID=A0A451CWJ4_9GAMM|nr:glutamine-hydrolyzing carbamoyl-phosphate synthase small subunit [Buchnera aphidicola]VFP77667.1 Carbamoyl-phosphate synthase small chain [Buchnera aphidicola (Cinara cf. splendens/pseudotsugae 3390)]
MTKLAHLILENGTIFYGISEGIEGETIGEIVFNTAMTGYQEIITDPSYYGQIISFTNPHIGNIGTNEQDEESKKIFAKGIITKSISSISSNFRSIQDLSEYIKKKKIIAISNIDTRKLTHILRKNGSQYGCIQSELYMNKKKAIINILRYKKEKKNKKNISIGVKNLQEWIPEKSINDMYQKKKFHVAVYDFGVKTSILNILHEKNCKITLISPTTSIEKVVSLKPSGILLSNGPGDPRLYTKAIKDTKKLLNLPIPIFGICLGHQILALSLGAKITKMKFGHHGSNHPIQNIYTKKVFITTQNHNFTVDKFSIPENVTVTYVSLFDNTIQGIAVKNHPSFSFQGHPESTPGTHDTHILFDKFIKNMQNQELKNA